MKPSLIAKVYDQETANLKTIADVKDGENTKLKCKATATGEAVQGDREAVGGNGVPYENLLKLELAQYLT